MFRAEG